MGSFGLKGSSIMQPEFQQAAVIISYQRNIWDHFRQKGPNVCFFFLRFQILDS